MLGSAVVRLLRLRGIPYAATARNPPSRSNDHSPLVKFSVGDGRLSSLVEGFGPGDFIINCIGMIKHRMDDSNARHRIEAIQANAEFPYDLADLAEKQRFRIIQIATDCVYSGAEGHYSEAAPHDALDVYGKTKSLGEVPNPQFLNLRCSIIGREIQNNTSLVEWLLSQTRDSEISGYSDHFWNGVTTEAFGKIAIGLIDSSTSLSGTFHVVPKDIISKKDLVTLILQAFGRTDVRVRPTITGIGVDRTLSTLFPDTNLGLWDLAGYPRPPAIEDMVYSVARFAAG